mgnify:CR=1 FL=1
MPRRRWNASERPVASTRCARARMTKQQGNEAHAARPEHGNTCCAGTQASSAGATQLTLRRCVRNESRCTRRSRTLCHRACGRLVPPGWGWPARCPAHSWRGGQAEGVACQGSTDDANTCSRSAACRVWSLSHSVVSRRFTSRAFPQPCCSICNRQAVCGRPSMPRPHQPLAPVHHRQTHLDGREGQRRGQAAGGAAAAVVLEGELQ